MDILELIGFLNEYLLPKKIEASKDSEDSEIVTLAYRGRKVTVEITPTKISVLQVSNTPEMPNAN